MYNPATQVQVPKDAHLGSYFQKNQKSCRGFPYHISFKKTMICALVSVMLLVRILFIDTSLHKPVVMFTEFSFRLGTSKV
jgi:hypothetical protein